MIEHVEIDNTPGEYYWGYPTWMTDEQIKAEFEKRFGFEPDRLERTGGCVRAGPYRKANK